MPNHRTTSVSQFAPAGTRADGALVTRAIRKLMDRRELSKAEHDALKRHEKQREDQLRRQYYGSIPQRHWREMSGRSTKVLNEQAARYGIPFGGPKIDLPAVVKALHEFLAKNAHKLVRDEDILLQGSNSPALERYREERAELARLDRLERQRKLVPREEAKQAWGRIAAFVRGACEALQRRFGSEAAEILIEALDDAQREIEHFFAETPVYQDDVPDQT